MAPFKIKLSTRVPVSSTHRNPFGKNDTLYYVKQITDYEFNDVTHEYFHTVGYKIVIAPNFMKLDPIIKRFLQNELSAYNSTMSELRGSLELECDGFKAQTLHDEDSLRQQFVVAVNARLTPSSEQKARNFMAPIIRAEQARQARIAEQQSAEKERKKKAKQLLKQSTNDKGGSSSTQVTRVAEKFNWKKSDKGA